MSDIIITLLTTSTPWAKLTASREQERANKMAENCSIFVLLIKDECCVGKNVVNRTDREKLKLPKSCADGFGMKMKMG
jgi:hypothetical protein